jgi:hypothetical protein
MYDMLCDLPHTRFAINSIGFLHDGHVLASGDDAGCIWFFDFPLGKELCRLRVTTAVTSLLWHPNTPVLFIGGARGNITVINLHVTVSANNDTIGFTSNIYLEHEPEAQGFSLHTGVNAPVDIQDHDGQAILTAS